MNRIEFYKTLRSISARYKMAKTRNGSIRGTSLSGLYPMCPITAVCDAVVGEYFPPEEALEAGVELKLPVRFINNVVRAADHAYNVLDLEEQVVRDELLAVIS